MPAFLNGRKQLSCVEANNTRCVTKVRWIIEGGMLQSILWRQFSTRCLINLVNGRIKQWRYFSQTIQNSSIPFVGGYLKIICALINAYQKPSIVDRTTGQRWATHMLSIRDKSNRLQQRLEEMASAAKKPQWKKYDARMVIFPTLSAEDVRNICFGKVWTLNQKRTTCIFLKVTTR